MDCSVVKNRFSDEAANTLFLSKFRLKGLSAPSRSLNICDETKSRRLIPVIVDDDRRVFLEYSLSHCATNKAAPTEYDNRLSIQDTHGRDLTRYIQGFLTSRPEMRAASMISSGVLRGNCLPRCHGKTKENHLFNLFT